ncbi:MAG TPA: FAD-dependent oxidoreductase [Polyangiaceae bacterium]|nr:FAD-dependent oxidoreductase [Polyangiaceae bacterium]
MPPRRLRAPHDPVTISLDGEALAAERDEPVVVALVAAGALALARSAKFHRPRGPSCLRAACEGCLARVDGEPNIMTCRARAREGTAVTTQNSLGSRNVDLLRMTDWFFPEGLNHHELFAGVPGLQSVMMSFARRVAGLGKLPSAVRAPTPARRRHLDVVVVGSGPSGMATALELAARGRHVTVLDDALAAGGVARALGAERGVFGPLLAAFSQAVAAGRVALGLEVTVGALYEGDLLAVGPSGAEVLTAETLVLATGAHDGQAIFLGNDLPGVLSARAAAELVAHGVLVGERVAWCHPEGPTAFGHAFAAAARAEGATVHAFPALPREVHGGTVVEGATFSLGGEEVIYDLDAVVLDLPSSPTYELAVQAGARVRHEPRGYVVVADRQGVIAPGGVRGVGELVGTPLEPERVLTEASRVAG